MAISVNPLAALPAATPLSTSPTSVTASLTAPGVAAQQTVQPTNPEFPSLVSDLFSSISTGAESLGQAAGETALAGGDTQEAGSYSSAQAIAQANQTVALAAGEVEQAQTGLQVRKTLGQQRAEVAARGFGSSGSSLALLRASTRQGTLQQQLIGENAQLQAGGFAEQGAAADAEAKAAQAAAAQATSLASSEQAIGAASKTNAINEAEALGATIPGIDTLSGTSVPSVDVNSLVNGNTTGGSLSDPTLLGGKLVSAQNPYVI